MKSMRRMASPIYEPLREAIRKSDAERVTAGEIVDALGPRAFGLTVIVLMAPVCLPMPPGVPTVAGVVLSMIAIQMMLAYRSPWLPGWVRRRSITRRKLLNAIDTLERRLKWIERVTRPRLKFLTRGLGAWLIGLAFLVMGIILIIPIPVLGNLPPAIAASILALALVQRDGLLALIGFSACAAAAYFTWHLAAATANLLG